MKNKGRVQCPNKAGHIIEINKIIVGLHVSVVSSVHNAASGTNHMRQRHCLQITSRVREINQTLRRKFQMSSEGINSWREEIEQDFLRRNYISLDISKVLLYFTTMSVRMLQSPGKGFLFRNVW